MKPSEYEFAIGDKVVTIYGDVGYVVDICECACCVKRGFHELMWKVDDDFDGDDFGDEEEEDFDEDNTNWVTIYDAERGFDEYYQIGKYRFNHKFDKEFVRRMLTEKELEVVRLKRQLKVIDELEKEVD